MLRYESKHPVSHTNGNFFEVNVQYHVFLQGKQLGPYDKRTIVGMRIKKTLSNSDLLIDAHGQQITVGALLGQRSRPAALQVDIGSSAFDSLQSGAYSPVVGVFEVQRMRLSKGLRDVPRFVGVVQARVHTDLLRLEGASGPFFKRKVGRVKLPFGRIVRVQQQNANLALWLSTDAHLNARMEGAPSISLMLDDAGNAKALMAALPEQVERGLGQAGAPLPVKKWGISAETTLWMLLPATVGVVLAVFVVLLLLRR